MKMVYLKSDSSEAARQAASSYKAFLSRKGVKVEVDKNNAAILLINNEFRVQFMNPKQYQATSITSPGRGYLCVPYNRLLLSKATPVTAENCKMGYLTKLILDSTGKEEKAEEISSIVEEDDGELLNDE